MIADAPAQTRAYLSRPGRLLCALLFAGVFLVGLIPRHTWVCDDALIYQNFVRNLLAGNGLSYSPENRVEGYSSPLWTLILALAGALGATGYTAARALSALCGMAVCVLPALLPLPRRAWPLLLAGGLVLALQTPLLWMSSTGMDTSLMALLLGLTGVAMLRGWLMLAAAAAGLIAVTRPEGAMYTFVAGIWLLLECRRLRCNASTAAAMVLLALAPALLWEFYRLHVYGAFLANAAYAKLGAGALLDSRRDGLGYLLGSMGHQLTGPWLLTAAAAAAVYRRMRRHPDTARDHAPAALLLMIVLGAEFAVAVGGDWMPQGRFLVPLIPLMLLLALHQLSGMDGPWRLAVAGLFAISVALAAAQQAREFRTAPEDLRPAWPAQLSDLAAPTQAYHSASLFAYYMLHYTVPGDSVVHFDLGQSGYFAADVRLIDQFGLVSAYESEFLHHRHADAEFVQHLRELSPSVIFFLRNRISGHSAFRVGSAIEPELADRYTLVDSIAWWGVNQLEVQVRNDVLARRADSARLARWEQQSPGLVFPHELMTAPGLVHHR